MKNLKLEKKWKDPSAMIAMSAVKSHQDKMECYACHASWVPQCYGCHVKVDYSKDKKGNPKAGTDWVSSANKRMQNGQTAESKLGTGGLDQAAAWVTGYIEGRTQVYTNSSDLTDPQI